MAPCSMTVSRRSMLLGAMCTPAAFAKSDDAIRAVPLSHALELVQHTYEYQVCGGHTGFDLEDVRYILGGASKVSAVASISSLRQPGTAGALAAQHVLGFEPVDLFGAI